MLGPTVHHQRAVHSSSISNVFLHLRTKPTAMKTRQSKKRIDINVAILTLKTLIIALNLESWLSLITAWHLHEDVLRSIDELNKRPAAARGQELTGDAIDEQDFRRRSLPLSSPLAGPKMPAWRLEKPNTMFRVAETPAGRRESRRHWGGWQSSSGRLEVVVGSSEGHHDLLSHNDLTFVCSWCRWSGRHWRQT